ncbi:MAG: UDP-N-acetylmuramoyl-L-alanyl-D-glutamate--2,6-diaminopimelate ligase [Hyphomicrobium sp.]|nr:UDP-N-acetylmuramoyl-L-alanyl-D-glutamate--2,6-diaminopimelate ligase [Hyphomicrobium sp.]PPD08865.1 MAG: UDP-N-acetylmuramoyl-L-alanyl-D-glutamate--2,6-diaminopimelate ligase [Hyphomicrobium sp.]
MRLSDLSALITVPPDAAALAVTGVTADSRTVTPGDLFIAIPGTKADGGRYIADAAARGAVAAIAAVGAAVPLGLTIPVLRTPDPRVALASIAARIYAGQPATVVAVTGTSGKTSVAEFTRQIFAACGREAASLGTIGVVSPKTTIYGSLTTPDPVSLHKTLASLAREGVTHLAMEASSHGLDQHRLDGVTIAAAAFTNLGRDHMDYHPTVEDYFAAKMRLFENLLPPDRPAIINRDGAYAAEAEAVARRSGRPVLTVGRSGETIKLDKAEATGFAQRLTLTAGGHTTIVDLPLVGAYQVENALVASALAIATGEDPAPVLAALATLKGVKGRLEIIGERNGGLGVVDYAHKPEALAAALDACRPFATGRLICVFGCGGDRDRGKRPIMGRIAAEKSDVVIVTDDNPRTETASAIRVEVLAGAAGATEIGDRAEAIRSAVAMMGPGDVVLVAGKGHETGQIVGETVLPFSDHDVLAEALGAL